MLVIATAEYKAFFKEIYRKWQAMPALLAKILHKISFCDRLYFLNSYWNYLTHK